MNLLSRKYKANEFQSHREQGISYPYRIYPDKVGGMNATPPNKRRNITLILYFTITPVVVRIGYHISAREMWRSKRLLEPSRVQYGLGGSQCRSSFLLCPTPSQKGQ